MKKRLLFVDDESNFLDGLRRLLREQHRQWDMVFVLSADEALEEMHSTPPDVVISDIRMPGKDGFDLLREIQSSGQIRDIPVIILTGSYEYDLKRQALEFGATDLLNKPVNLEDLIARIRSVLRLKSYQDELKNLNASLDNKVKERTKQLEQSQLDIVWRLAKAGEYRDDVTGDHIIRVGCYCRALTEKLALSGRFLEDIFFTGPLHDIGKIGIPDSILLKKGKLTPEEWEIMKTHCVKGADILMKAPRGLAVFQERGVPPRHLPPVMPDNRLLKIAATIAVRHHEKWDGTGYPNALEGRDIPLEARIVAIADTYDALRSDRPYKSAYPEDKAIAIIKKESARQFDPDVVAAFETSINEFREIGTRFSDKALHTPKEEQI